MRTSYWAPTLLVCAAASCLPNPANVNCTDNLDCPAGYGCDGVQKLCVAQHDASAADHPVAGDAWQPADGRLLDVATADRIADAHIDASHVDATHLDVFSDRVGADSNADAGPPPAPDASHGDAAVPDSCVPGCAGHVASDMYCTEFGGAVTRCDLDGHGCPVASEVDVCDHEYDCVERSGDAWCAPLIVSFDVFPDPWSPTTGATVALIMASYNADTCTWGASTIYCNGTTPIAATNCPVCEGLELRACNGSHCATEMRYARCATTVSCSCTLSSWICS